MAVILFALLFILGANVGSFLNVVILRYDPEGPLFSFRHLGGRSHCPHCGRTLTLRELIPVLSFLALRGRCRTCRARLTLQYPLVELISGVIFVAVPLVFNHLYWIPNAVFAVALAPGWYYGLVGAWVLAFLAWLLIAAIDLRTYVIPNELTFGVLLIGIFVAGLTALHGAALPPTSSSFLGPYVLLFNPVNSIFWNRVLGAAVGVLSFGLLWGLSRGRAMGFGDVKLGFAIGVLLGWPDIAFVVLLSFFIGGAVGLVALLRRRKRMKDRLPFAPFLVLASALTVFLGSVILTWYFRLFGLS